MHTHKPQIMEKTQSSTSGEVGLPVLSLGMAHALTIGCLNALAQESPPDMTQIPPATFTPGPVTVGWEIWVGFAAGVIPFMIGAWEFTKRILIQRRCEVCQGSGLVASLGPGKDKYLRKCPQCGGFFPWISWSRFLSANAQVGNGGPLQQPRGQTSVFYKVPPPPPPTPVAPKEAGDQEPVQVGTASKDSTQLRS